MLNPYILLGLFVSLLAATFGGYHYGYSRAEDAISARATAAQEQAIDRANKDVEAATARTLAQARAEAAAKLAAATIRLKGERDAAIKSRPECARDADSMRLLTDSIAASNGTAPASSSLPDFVHPAGVPGVGK